MVGGVLHDVTIPARPSKIRKGDATRCENGMMVKKVSDATVKKLIDSTPPSFPPNKNPCRDVVRSGNGTTFLVGRHKTETISSLNDGKEWRKASFHLN